MKLQKTLLLLIFCLITVGVGYAQKSPASTNSSNQAIKSSPAYAEILLRKTELECRKFADFIHRGFSKN
jgi:hypothetical protein